MRILIRFHIKVMGICDRWPTCRYPPGLYISILSLHASLSVHGPLRLHFEPLKLLTFEFNADTVPDPATKINAYPVPLPAI
jgi:hypothetical protein